MERPMTRVPVVTAYACMLFLSMACDGKMYSPTSPTATAGSCQLTIDPRSQTAPPSGGSFYTTVTGPCAWDAVADDSWISVTYGEGTGVGSVTYTVQENPGSTT